MLIFRILLIRGVFCVGISFFRLPESRKVKTQSNPAKTWLWYIRVPIQGEIVIKLNPTIYKVAIISVHLLRDARYMLSPPPPKLLLVRLPEY